MIVDRENEYVDDKRRIMRRILSEEEGDTITRKSVDKRGDNLRFDDHTNWTLPTATTATTIFHS